MKDKLFVLLEWEANRACTSLKKAFVLASTQGQDGDVEETVVNHISGISRLMGAAIILDPIAFKESETFKLVIETSENIDEGRLSFLWEFYGNELKEWSV